jgi:ribonuclease VapC
VVVDSSALVSVLLRERGFERLAGALEQAPVLRVSAVTRVEASIVMLRYHGEAGIAAVDRLLTQYGAAVDGVTPAHALTARSAFLRYGKGRHRARLNFGDCFSHALARERDEPLLFIGGDLALTDVRIAVT